MRFKHGKNCKNSNCKKTNCTDFMCGVIRQYPIFTQYISPNGGLDSNLETHALFYYYLLARQAYEAGRDAIVYEGDKDPEFNYTQILKSVAKWYSIDVHNMVNAWKAVDLTCFMHKLPTLPNKYRLPK
jgi:hypothetical protein